MPVDEWDQAYNAVQVTPAMPAPAPKRDEWDEAFDTVVGEAADKGPMAEKFLRGTKRLMNIPVPGEQGTWKQRATGAGAKGFMLAGEALTRLPPLVISQAKLASSYAQAEAIHAAEGNPEEQKSLQRDMKRSEKAYDSLIAGFSETANWHNELQKGILANHPEWETEPPENIVDLVMSPDKLSMALIEATPLLLTAGFLTAGGQPHAAAALMFATESNQAYHEAKQDDESDDTAYDAAAVYGLVAAGIEQMQLGHIMKIGKGAYKSILNRTVQKVSKDGIRNVTKAVITIAAKEAAEEMAQGTWGEITAKAIYDRPILAGGGVKGFIDRRAQEAYIGFMMGVIPGAGGAAGGKIASRLRGKEQTGRRQSGEDASPEELQRDIAVLKRAYIPRFGAKMTSIQNSLDNILAKAGSEESNRQIAGADLTTLNQQMDTMSQEIENNPKLLGESARTKELLSDYTGAVNAFLDSPSKKKFSKVKTIGGEIGRLGRSYADYFDDTIRTLRKHPGYENERIVVKDDRGQDNEIAPITSTVPAETIDDLARRDDKKALEAAQTTEGKAPVEQQTEEGTTPSKSPYTLVETQSGMEIHDKQTGRIVDHFDNFDKNSDTKAVKRLNELNSNPKLAAKYDKSTNGQKARITILGKRLGLIDKKGKVKPAFRRFVKGTTGKTSRKALTYGEAKKLITVMEEHRPTFRVGDKVTPTGFDVAGEVIHLNKQRGLATVQFKNKTTGDMSSRIFNMQELAFLGEVQVATEEMVETIRESQKVATPKDEVLGQRENRLLKKYWQETKRFVTGWHLGQIRVARMLEWLDGHTKGINWHRIFLPMNQASMEADDAINQRLGDLQGFMAKTFGPERMKQILTGKRTPVADPQFKDKISLSPAERIGYYVLSKNKDGLRRIKRGNLGSFGNREAALKAVLDSVTEQEKQLGDWALEQLQAQYPRANQAAIIALGRELTPADNYFPLYSPADTVGLDQQVDFLTQLEEKAGAPKTSLEISEAQERVKTSTGPVETDFFRSYLHNIARVERFINMAPAVNEVQNLLNNKEYRHALNKATNGYGVKILHNWMKDTTKGKSSEVNDWTGKLLTGLRRNAMVYAIGFNISSMMRQTLSLGNAIAIDPLMMKHIPINWMKNKQGWDNYRTMENEVMGKSLMMRTRSFDRVESILNSLPATQKRLMGKKDYSRKALGFIRWMDRHTTVLSWRSLYDVALDRKMSEEQAVAFADDGISKTQPMGNARDLPDFFRGGPLQKLLTTFQNQVNQNYNFWTHDIVGELRAGKISKRTAVHRVAFSYVIPALLFGMIGRGGPPEDWKDVVKDLALYPLGSLFLVGRVIYNTAQGFAGGGTSVAEIGVSELEKTIAAGFRGDVGKVVKHGIKAIGALTGRIPAQAIRTAEGAYDLAQNETDDWRRLIYSEWALSRGDKGGTAPAGRKRKLRRRTTRKRKLRRR